MLVEIEAINWQREVVGREHPASACIKTESLLRLLLLCIYCLAPSVYMWEIVGMLYVLCSACNKLPNRRAVPTPTNGNVREKS